MPQIYSAAAAAVDVDDHRRLLVRLSQRNSRRCGYGDQYLIDISSEALSQNKVDVCFPYFSSDSYGGFCGGLLYFHSNEGKTVIMNPITREYSSLPPSEVERPKNTNRSCYTACGLGFDSQSSDYKVLRSVFNYCETFNGIFDDGRPDTTSCLQSQFEIYSLKNDSWKVIPYNIGSIQGCGVYVNTRKCYWRTHHPFNSVISFDFEKESFSSPIPLPPSLRTWSIDGIDIVDDLDKFGGMDIFEYKGSLAIVGYKKLGGGGGLYTLCKAWVLKEEEQEWEEEFGVKVFGDHKPVGFGKNGQSLFLEGNYVEKKVAYQLLEYDLIDRYLKELPIFAEMSSCMQILSSYDDPVGIRCLKRRHSGSGKTKINSIRIPTRIDRATVSTGSTEQGQGLNKRRAAVGSSWMTKEEETRITASKEVIARGSKSDNGCKAGYVSKLEDGLKKKDPGTDLKGNPHINTWYQNYYSQSQGLSGFEVGFEVYGKLVSRGGDYQVNCVYHILPKNKGKKRKSDAGVEQVCSLVVEQLD
ncbi:hypothetical protein OROHE_006031 [Orobanche hederae]